MSLGGILLCITGKHLIASVCFLFTSIMIVEVFLNGLDCYSGSEAMFADLGHFSQLSIKVWLSEAI